MMKAEENPVPPGILPHSADTRLWFAMRDLKRRNARLPAYKALESLGIECFTPMVHRLVVVRGRREHVEMPFMQDLLFVRESRLRLDPVVESIPTLQYRYVLGAYRTPMVIRSADMERFILAVKTSPSPQYYRPEEITPEMRNRKIRIIGGQLDGYEGTLVTLRGSKTKRLLVELPMLLAATVEVEPEYIQLL